MWEKWRIFRNPRYQEKKKERLTYKLTHIRLSVSSSLQVLMASSARDPSRHDALHTDRYRPNPPVRSLRAAADSKAHLLSPLPDLDLFIRFSSASRTVQVNRSKYHLLPTPDWIRKKLKQKKRKSASELPSHAFRSTIPCYLFICSSNWQKQHCSRRRQSRCHIQVSHVSLT